MSTPIGLQLYTVREAAEQDYARTMERVAALGYDGVETAGFPGTTPVKAAQLFNDLGLKVAGAHGPLPVGDTRQQALEMMAALGATRLITPWLDPKHFADVTALQATADLLSQAAAEAKAAGLTFHYHNHWFEPALVEGKPAFAHLLERVSPDVHFELDLYWCQVGGLTPQAAIEMMGERAKLLHVKDGPADSPQSPMVAVGDGTLDYRTILASTAAEWFVVELDHCATDMFTAVERSVKYLKTM